MPFHFELLYMEHSVCLLHKYYAKATVVVVTRNKRGGHRGNSEVIKKIMVENVHLNLVYTNYYYLALSIIINYNYNNTNRVLRDVKTKSHVLLHWVLTVLSF